MVEKDEILTKIKESAVEGKISCTDARQLAADFNIELGKMNDLCDEIEIKIYACELGCF
ncbi:MAG TPA: hypothetical protein VFC73_09125 [Syntrophomonadaceae bacterium]|nr:hypothetical protein [Syntrophomonadaceae bacterium]